MIFRRSTDVLVLHNPLDYRDIYLRPDFQFRCAYCLTHEYYFLDGEAGQIDHHRPLHPPAALGLDFSHLRSVYGNLYWCCSRCNLCKGNNWPTNEQYEAGIRFLDPCVEDHDAHWDTHPDGTVTAKTPVGHYSVRIIRLDRPRLNKRRAEVHQYSQKRVQIMLELEQIDLSPQHRRTLQDYLADIETRINPPVFRIMP